MKTCIKNYKKCILAVLLAGGAGLFLAASNDPQAAIKIEGAWVGNVAENGVRVLVTFAPNASGKSATYRAEMVWPPEVLAVWAQLVPGFRGITDAIGEQVMTGRNTATYAGRWYVLVDGRPALVFVDNASLTYTSPTRVEFVSEITGYYADAEGDPVEVALPTGMYHSVSRRITQ